jgi:plasmid stabilization system protein ParE
MTAEQGFRLHPLHPLAALDITGIWEYIAEDNPLAARRVREEILSRIRAVVSFPNRGHKRPDLTGRRPCASSWFVNI